jgi:hypothetical protein
MMAKEVDFCNCKLALLLIDDQSSCLEAAKNFFHILLRLLHRLVGHDDADVIKVDEDEVRPSPSPSSVGRYSPHSLGQKEDKGTRERKTKKEG